MTLMMPFKKVTAAVFLLFFYFHGVAQTQKGNFAIAGSSDLNFLFSKSTLLMDSIETSRSKSNQYSFSAGAGYFFADNLMIGVSGAYSYQYTNIAPGSISQGGNQNIVTSIGIIPQLTYFFPVTGKVRPSAAIGVGYLLMKERDSRVQEGNNEIYSYSGPSFNGAAGVSWFVNNWVAVDFGIQYSYNRLKNKVIPQQVQKQKNTAAKAGISFYF